MGDSLRVVVGIPTYNNEDTIKATLDQVTAQTRPPDRIVICDNSSDATRAVIRAAQEKVEIPIEILTQEGDGVADAYNQIWRHIEPDFDLLATIQTNLAVPDHWLEKHVAVHREHPEIGIVTASHEGLTREVSPHERPYYRGRNISFKRSALDAVQGWDTNFLRGEDWDMRIRLASAGVRAFTSSEVSHEWLGGDRDIDPYIDLSKAKRRPTAVTFLAKYGSWYARYHPSHVVHDILCVSGVLLAVSTILTLPIAPFVSVAAFGLLLLVTTLYIVGHLLVRGRVDDDLIRGPVRKQFLNGISVLYALKRVSGDVEWNRTGFDPDQPGPSAA